MKFLLVNKFHYKKGGSETYYFTLAAALRKAGHQVVFFAMEDEKNIPCEQSKYFVSNVSVNGGLTGKIKMIKNIAYSKEAYNKINLLLDVEQPDVAILNLVHKQITCSIIDALKNHNVKIVWTMHDLITVCPSYTMIDGRGNICEKCIKGDFSNCKKNKCVHGSKLMSILSTYEANYIKKKKWYNDVDLYICPSEFYKNKLCEAKFTSSKIIHMANPLPLDTKYCIIDNPEDYVLYFGRLSYEKGIKTLIKAAKNIDIKVKIVGTGPIFNEMKELIRNEKLQVKVELLGYKTGEDLISLIHNSKMVVLPSEWYENGPYSAMEAMAAGKPLIVSNLGGLPELVNDGENGYIFSARDSLELSKCINRIQSLCKDDYLKMCECSKSIAKYRFDSNDYVKKLIDVLEKGDIL